MTPGCTSTTSPGSAVTVRSPTRKRIVPAVTSKRSVWTGWTWGIGTEPPGRSAKSKARSSPSVLAAVWVKVKRSPVTGFSTVSPGWMRGVLNMSSSLSPVQGRVYDTKSPIHARSSRHAGRAAGNDLTTTRTPRAPTIR